MKAEPAIVHKTNIKTQQTARKQEYTEEASWLCWE